MPGNAGTSPTARLHDLGYEMPGVPVPTGSYVPATKTGNIIFTAGQLPLRDGVLTCEGKVGGTVSLEEAQEAAKTCTLNALAAVSDAAGGLDNIVRILKVVGYVASAPGFTSQPQVLNAASALLGDVFGEQGLHARSAIGVSELPLGAPVEIELIAETD